MAVAGTLAGVFEGDRLDIVGEEVLHPRFGRQVKVHSFCHYIPSDLDGLKSFLGSGRFPGIGEKTAQKLVDGFGEELLEVLEKDPKRLAEVKGVSRKAAQTLGEEYAALRSQRELMIKLAPFGVGQETLYRILAVYGQETLQVIGANPYRLMSEVRGVGFRTADTIARAMGFQKEHPLRVQSALVWLVEQLEQRRGDMVFPVGDLLSRAQRQFDMPVRLLDENLRSLVERGVLIRVEQPFEGVCRPECYWAEKTIAQSLTHLLAQPSLVSCRHGEERDRELSLTDNQAHAVSMAFHSPILMVTGGPGTGKTTIIREIVRGCMERDLAVAVAAPTGRAAKRIEESSGYAASTIHRLLKIDPESGKFVHQQGNPLDFEMVVIDEFSMVDAFLFAALLRAIKPGAHLVLIGDKDQLPSVGPGNVIRDLIDSSRIPISFLTHNFRQEDAAPLLYLSDCVQEGRADLFLQACRREHEQFRFIPAETEIQAQEIVLAQLETLLERFPIGSLEYQVLSPMYRGEAGVDRLNHLIQERFNSREVVFETPTRQFRLGDRVMQLRNNYQLEVFNGEQGTVCAYDGQRRMLKVDFAERSVELSRDQVDDIVLSYVSTVHKAQGAEFQEVLLCLLPQYGIMLNRELFYTALTRARRRVVLVGSEDALVQAIDQTMPRYRKTLLPVHLQEEALAQQE